LAPLAQQASVLRASAPQGDTVAVPASQEQSDGRSPGAVAQDGKPSRHDCLRNENRNNPLRRFPSLLILPNYHPSRLWNRADIREDVFTGSLRGGPTQGGSSMAVHLRVYPAPEDAAEGETQEA